MTDDRVPTLRGDARFQNFHQVAGEQVVVARLGHGHLRQHPCIDRRRDPVVELELSGLAHHREVYCTGQAAANAGGVPHTDAGKSSARRVATPVADGGGPPPRSMLAAMMKRGSRAVVALALVATAGCEPGSPKRESQQRQPVAALAPAPPKAAPAAAAPAARPIAPVATATAQAGAVDAHGWNSSQINWVDYEQGLAQAKAGHKPVCLVFFTTWCPHCKNYSHVFEDPRVVAEAKKFVMIRLDGDRHRSCRRATRSTAATCPAPTSSSPTARLPAPRARRAPASSTSTTSTTRPACSAACTRPRSSSTRTTGAIIGGWAGLTGSVALTLACPSTSVAHIVLGHGSAIVIGALVGAALGRRLLSP